jgi:hypothetical protein
MQSIRHGRGGHHRHNGRTNPRIVTGHRSQVSHKSQVTETSSAFGFPLPACFCESDGVLDPAPTHRRTNRCRGGFILPMQDAFATHEAIGRGCQQPGGFTVPGFWAGNPAPTTVGRSPAPADGQRRRRHPVARHTYFRQHDSAISGFRLSAFRLRPPPASCFRLPTIASDFRLPASGSFRSCRFTHTPLRRQAVTSKRG